MQFRRYYADLAKARQLLSNAFRRMERDGYVKSDAQRQEIEQAARELNVAPAVARQAYEAACVAGARTESAAGATGAATVSTPKQAQPASTLSETQRKRLAQQADIEMFGPPRTEQYESAEFQYDDMPSLAHLHLEEHRSAREFVRSAAYELPLLAQYRSAYRPPGAAQTLRFKHFAVLGEPQHPAASKVVLTFAPESTGLSTAQLHKLKLLAGRRFDEVRNEVRISANQFPSQAQNKRYLGQIYSKLVAAAKEGDSFEDVALDQRHALKRQRVKHVWPEQWSRPDLAPKTRDDIYAFLR